MDKNHWLVMAEEWLRMAEDAAVARTRMRWAEGKSGCRDTGMNEYDFSQPHTLGGVSLAKRFREHGATATSTAGRRSSELNRVIDTFVIGAFFNGGVT